MTSSLRSTRLLSLLVVSAIMAAACSPGAAGPGSTTSTPSTTTTGATSSTATTVITGTTTAPTPPGELLVVGDWGYGTLPQGAVAGAMSRHAETVEVEAILTTGDNFYSDDADFLMAPYGWAADAGIPFWVTWGNHDVETPQRIETVNQAFDDPPRWAIYEWGGVDVVVLDSTQVASVEQDAFLTSALSGSGDPAIVVFHHPPYTCGTYEGNDDIAEAWLPDLDDDVVMVLNGHDHNYQRFEDGGVAYVVTGGGGAPVYELEACPAGDPAPVAGEALHHFLAMRQGEDVIEVTVVDVNGATIDSFEVAIP